MDPYCLQRDPRPEDIKARPVFETIQNEPEYPYKYGKKTWKAGMYEIQADSFYQYEKGINNPSLKNLLKNKIQKTDFALNTIN